MTDRAPGDFTHDEWLEYTGYCLNAAILIAVALGVGLGAFTLPAPSAPIMEQPAENTIRFNDYAMLILIYQVLHVATAGAIAMFAARSIGRAGRIRRLVATRGGDNA